MKWKKFLGWDLAASLDEIYEKIVFFFFKLQQRLRIFCIFLFIQMQSGFYCVSRYSATSKKVFPSISCSIDLLRSFGSHGSQIYILLNFHRINIDFKAFSVVRSVRKLPTSSGFEKGKQSAACLRSMQKLQRGVSNCIHSFICGWYRIFHEAVWADEPLP